MNMFGTIIGIDKVNNNKVYRVLISKYIVKNNNYDWKFECKMMNEQQILSSFSSGAIWSNVKVENGKLKGSSGDLERFNNKVNNPYVILSQIVDNNKNVLGYKVANYAGGVKNTSIKDMIAYGNRVTKQGGVPIQNAIFVSADESKKAHYKAYPDCRFIEEVLVKKENKYTEVKRVNTNQNAKTLTKLEDLYNKEQIAQLRLGKSEGLDIRVYANPAISAESMYELRMGMKAGVNVRPLAHPDFKPEAIKFYITELKDGIDIRQFLNPKYDLGQIASLSLAVDLGLDISKMANPKLKAVEMDEIRERLERGIWKDELVKRDGSWI